MSGFEKLGPTQINILQTNYVKYLLIQALHSKNEPLFINKLKLFHSNIILNYHIFIPALTDNKKID